MNAADAQPSAAREVFLDTNILLHLLSAETAKADIAQALLRAGGVVSVQVLNEFASVASRKLRMPFSEVQELLYDIRRFCQVTPLTIETHELGMAYCARFGYSVYDSMILAAATLADCKTLMSEDMQSNQVIMQRLIIHDPFEALR